MSETLQAWLESLPTFPGLLARGVRLPDHRTHCQSFAEACPLDSLETLGRSLADTSRVLGMHRFPSDRLCWTYEKARVHGLRRSDDLLMFWVVERDSADAAREELDRQAAAFLG